MTTKTESKTSKSAGVPELVDMLQAGVHFGHDRSKRNPKMESNIFSQRNRIAIIDLEKTQQALIKAVEFVGKLVSESNKDVLFVGTKRQARGIVRRHAEAAQMPYVTKRWLGGTLTNFATIQKSIEKLEELKVKRDDKELQEKITKKEKAVMNKEIERLEAVLEGLKDVKALPGAVFVVGAHDEKLAVREAKRVGIPVIGIADTNVDPALLDYAIPANDDAVRALDLVVRAVANTIISVRGGTPAEPIEASVTPVVAEESAEEESK